MSFIEPFDFSKIFVDSFLGSPVLFTFAGVILISIALAYFRVPDKIYLPMLALFCVMFAVTNFIDNSIYALMLLIVGLITFKSIAGIVT